MSEKGRRWSREETVIALDLYFRIPFAKSNKDHPEVVKVAKLLGRSPSSINLKVGNFGSLDAKLKVKGIKGLDHTSALDREVWNDFEGKHHNLVYENHKLTVSQIEKNSPQTEVYKLGEEILRLSKERVGQRSFRERILASYNSSCCITGLKREELLVASHIKPWAQSTEHEKLNPGNGLCLNALHDRAFDRGLITINPDYKIKISGLLKERNDKTVNSFFEQYEGKQIELPERLPPDRDFLAWHGENIFIAG